MRHTDAGKVAQDGLPLEPEDTELTVPDIRLASRNAAQRSAVAPPRRTAVTASTSAQRSTATSSTSAHSAQRTPPTPSPTQPPPLPPALPPPSTALAAPPAL